MKIFDSLIDWIEWPFQTLMSLFFSWTVADRISGLTLIVLTVTMIYIALQARHVKRQVRLQTREGERQTENLKLQRKAHLVSSIETLQTVWQSEPMLRLRQKANSHLLKILEDRTNNNNKNLEHQDKMISPTVEAILEFFDRVAAYETLEAIDTKAVWEVFSWYMEYYFAIVQNDLNPIRGYYRDSIIFENFEEVSKKMRSLTEDEYKDGGECPDWEDIDLQKKFLMGELDLIKALLGVRPISKYGNDSDRRV